MKKGILCAMLVLVLFLAACGRSRLQIDEYYPQYQSCETYNYIGTITTAGEAVFSVGEPNPTIKDLLLYDLDYLMQLFEDVFPSINVLYRTMGVDARALGDAAREIIENYPYSLQTFAYSLGIAFEDMPELDAQVFWGILFDEIFRPIMPFAHINVMCYNAFRHTSFFTRGSGAPIDRHGRRAYDNIIAMQFYRVMETSIRSFRENNPELLQFYYRFAPVSLESQRMRPPGVTTKILEEDRVAYMQVSSFSPEATPAIFSSRYGDLLVDFYYKIQDYEHLIIDIRGNTGGNINVSLNYFILPLFSDRDNLPDMPLYVLHAGSERGRHYAELSFESMPLLSSRSFILQSDSLLTIDEILDSGSLSYLNNDDLQLIAYGYRIYLSLSNIVGRHNNLPHIPFNGQVWVLTCNRNFSGAAMYARLAKYTGFATLVGETIGGLYSLPSMVAMPLPNTGIAVIWDIDYITDVYGRALNEFPTQPHYFNRPGMDALETVLAMIAESRG